jgi:hypothetical protein
VGAHWHVDAEGRPGGRLHAADVRTQRVAGGAFKALTDKALQLTGSPSSPPPPPDRNVYGALMASGQADVFITYCTKSAASRRPEPTDSADADQKKPKALGE